MGKSFSGQIGHIEFEEPVLGREADGTITASIRFRVPGDGNVSQVHLELVDDEWNVVSCEVEGGLGVGGQ